MSVFESFDQTHHLRGLRARQLDVILRHHANLGGGQRNSRFGERLFDFVESFRRGNDVPDRAVVFHQAGDCAAERRYEKARFASP